MDDTVKEAKILFLIQFLNDSPLLLHQTMFLILHFIDCLRRGKSQFSCNCCGYIVSQTIIQQNKLQPTKQLHCRIFLENNTVM